MFEPSLKLQQTNLTLKTVDRFYDTPILQVKWESPKKLPERLLGDPMRLKQVLINLTKNA
jgi:signal transduction histidine kinase